jgi:hypothetical protein
MLRMNKFILAVTFAAAGCLGSAPTSTPSTDPTMPSTPSDNSSTPANSSNPATPSNPSGAPSDPSLGLVQDGTAGGMGTTFDHDKGDEADPFEVLQRIQDTGAPEISTRMHSCQKLKYATLGNVLTALGVNMAKTATPPSAGQLYKGGAGAMGGPNYTARVRETIEGTASGFTKLFDIFVQAAPEIITAMPNNAACKKAGAATQMFDAQGKCTPEGIACLQGAPASQAQVDLCNTVLTEASTAAVGQAIAVASILAAANTCE